MFIFLAFDVAMRNVEDIYGLDNIIDGDNDTCIELSHYLVGRTFDLILYTFQTTTRCNFTVITKEAHSDSITWHVLSSDQAIWGEQHRKTRYIECDFIGVESHQSGGHRVYQFSCQSDIVCEHQRFIVRSDNNEHLCEIITN